ncbi:hypothetical protein PCURB6_16400 [Paenibacillus curdlanolyticus]|nr:hypothetical protein PCURB6_16400 [Paenibacillus curdlanolyticus]
MRRLMSEILAAVVGALLLYHLVSRYTEFSRPYFLFIIATIVMGSSIWRFYKRQSDRKGDKK